MKYIDADHLREELQKPKAELKVVNYYLDNSEQAVGYENALSDFESLIDSLQQEQPVDRLEEEITRYLREKCSSDDEPSVSEIARHFAEWGEKNAYKAIMKKADEVRDKRFDTDYEVKIEPAAGFGSGCVNVYHEGKLVGQYVEPKEEKKLHEGVKEAAEEHIQSVVDAAGHPGWDWETHDVTDAFIAVAEWQKAKMMEEAVEADIMLTLHDKTGDVSLHTGYLPKELGIKCSDKVRVIVIKEDEK